MRTLLRSLPIPPSPWTVAAISPSTMLMRRGLQDARTKIPAMPVISRPGAEALDDLDALVQGTFDNADQLEPGRPNFPSSPFSISRSPMRRKSKDELTPEDEFQIESLAGDAMQLVYSTRPGSIIIKENVEEKKTHAATMEEYFFSRPCTTQLLIKFLEVLKAKRAPVSEVQRVIAEVKRKGIKPSSRMMTAVFAAIAASRDNEKLDGRLKNSKLVFEILDMHKVMQVERNHLSYGAMANALAKACDSKGALSVLKLMKDDGITPTEIVYTAVIHACLADNQVEEAWNQFREMRHQGIMADPLVFNTMIRICAETEDAERAIRLFEEMKNQGLIPDIVTYHSLIYALSSRKDYYEKAFDFFREALEMNFDPEPITFNVMFSACAWQHDLSTLFFLWDTMEERKIQKDLRSYNIYLSALARVSDQQQFQIRDNQYLTADERIQMAWNAFEEMQRRGIRPNNMTLNILVSIYSGTLRMKAYEIVETLFPEYGIKPDYFTYKPLLKACVKKRHLVQAQELVAKMREEGIPIYPEVHLDLLIICRRKRDLEAGLQVLKEMRADGFEPADTIRKDLLEIFEPPPRKLLPPSFNRFLASGRASQPKGAAQTRVSVKFRKDMALVQPREIMGIKPRIRRRT
eukprot:gb/GEZN01003875.1/.p1 GENE.gb/GEZN01003875.1/~~gb/GEZN01003875.1/.p1  ORF type:complete len:634 (+),score=73.81 gb/GEZN01003875.1/:27-1928(+)